MISSRGLTERLLYILLVIMFVFNLLALAEVIGITHRLDARTIASKQNTSDTRSLVICIAKFFDTQNRQEKTISTANIDDCNVSAVK